MAILSYQSQAALNPRRSALALWSLALGVANLGIIIAGLYCIGSLDATPAEKFGFILGLILESVPVFVLTLASVIRVQRSRGILRGLLPAVIGSFLASSSGLVAMCQGFDAWTHCWTRIM
ncbi:MAG TPA: hypothetical protein VM008_12865 [Phycisphaerae bacterium]|nr:hypothetical protein [Phycisphaerae bacterium]